MTNAYRPSEKVRTIAGWIEQAAISGEDVTRLQLRTWATALRVPMMGLESVERALDARPGIEFTGAERFSRTDAEQLLFSASRLIEQLAIAAIMGQSHPMPDNKINEAACALIDVMHGLTYGVRRPDLDATQQTVINQPEIGA